jgi:hypothetical protein
VFTFPFGSSSGIDSTGTISSSSGIFCFEIALKSVEDEEEGTTPFAKEEGDDSIQD